jgi:hypothetical protein
MVMAALAGQGADELPTAATTFEFKDGHALNINMSGIVPLPKGRRERDRKRNSGRESMGPD